VRVLELRGAERLPLSYLGVSVVSKNTLLLADIETHIDDLVDKCKSIDEFTRITFLVRERNVFKGYIDESKPDTKFRSEAKYETWEHGRIDSEIDAADEYIEKWKQTGLERYREIAEDELAHADIILTDSKLSPTAMSMYKDMIQERMTIIKGK